MRFLIWYILIGFSCQPFVARGEDTIPNPAIDATIFDLYLGDKFRGSLLVSYTDDWFEIDDPNEALEQIKEFSRKREELTPLVSGRIPKEKIIPGIGRVSYDLNTFRIVIEPEPAFLQANELDLSRKVMTPNSGLTLQQSFGASAITQDNLDSQSAFSHRSFASYDEFFSKINGVAVQNRPYELNEANVGGIIGDYQIGGGLLQAHGQSFVPSLQFLGVQIDTAEQLFLDDELSRGSPIELFIPSRSTVQFYRDGQLLAVKVLDYGLQEIDTSNFPQGSYDIDVIITESSGRESRERRFFTKAGFLASRGRPVFSFSAGAVRNRLEFLDTPFLSGGIRTRLTDILDVGFNISGTDKTTIQSINTNAFYRGVRFGAAVAHADDNARGVQGNIGFTLMDVSFDGRITRTYGADSLFTPTPTPTPGDPLIIPIRNELRKDLTLQEQESTSFSAYKNIGSVDLRYNVERNKIGADNTRYSNGPTIGFRIKESVKENLTARTSYLSTEQGNAKTAQLLYRYRLSSDWAVDSQILQRWQPNRGETLLLVGLTFDSIRGLATQGSRLQTTVEAQKHDTDSGTSRSNNATFNGEITTQYIKGVSFARGVHQNGENVSTLGFNAESAFLISDNGEVAIAHPVQTDTAFIAEVQGDDLSKNTTFEVIVDGQVREIIKPGEKAVVGLAPYKIYKANIRPTEDASIVTYDTTIYEFSLFPGNVVKRMWKVDKVFIALGRVIDETGEVIARERIRGTKEYTFTEEDGTFQAEVTGNEPLYIDSKRRHCTLDISFPTKPDYYAEFGDIVCKATVLKTAE